MIFQFVFFAATRKSLKINENENLKIENFFCEKRKKIKANINLVYFQIFFRLKLDQQVINKMYLNGVYAAA